MKKTLRITLLASAIFALNACIVCKKPAPEPDMERGQAEITLENVSKLN